MEDLRKELEEQARKEAEERARDEEMAKKWGEQPAGSSPGHAVTEGTGSKEQPFVLEGGFFDVHPEVELPGGEKKPPLTLPAGMSDEEKLERIRRDFAVQDTDCSPPSEIDPFRHRFLTHPRQIDS